jgi:hypothetical protein
MDLCALHGTADPARAVVATTAAGRVVAHKKAGRSRAAARAAAAAPGAPMDQE